jgi:hypothetical protein
MALTLKTPLQETTLQIVFPADPPKLPASAIAAYPELKGFNEEMDKWWFTVRSNLRRMQERLGQPASGSLVATGVTPGTYGPTG